MYTLEKIKQIESENNIVLVYNNNAITKNTIIQGNCLTEKCPHSFCKKFIHFLKTGCYCRNCSKINGYKKAKETIFKKYGVSNLMQVKEIREKIKKTNLERYGVENVLYCEEVKSKVKETIKNKYGVDNVSQCEEIKEKIKRNNFKKYGVEHTLQVKEMREKGKLSNLEKYGVEYTSQREDIKEKIKQTNMEKRGVPYNLQCEKVKEKIKKTNLLRYGVEHNLQCKEVKEKMKKTNLLRYGAEHVMHNAEIFQKNQRAHRMSKKYISPLNEEYICRGYEPFALRDLFKDEEYLKEKNLIKTKNIPTVMYTFNEKNHKYFPDIYIENENLIIEIKSKYSLNYYREKNFAKQNAMKNAGYLCEIWVYNEKGIRREIYP